MRFSFKCFSGLLIYTAVIVCILYLQKEIDKSDVVIVHRRVGENLPPTQSLAPEWKWFGRDCSGLYLGLYRTTLIPQAKLENVLLPQDVIAGVKYFAIFLGFGRGGTTLVGALLDGHPNIVLATDYQLFIKWPQYRTYHQEISQLYSALHQYSISFAKYFRYNSGKGYSFDLPGAFNGRYNESILVIGEKEAGSTTVLYMSEHQEWMRTLKEVQETVKVPIKAVQVLRNPLDTIATQMAYETFGEMNRTKFQGHVLINHSSLLDAKIDAITCCYEAVQHMQSNPKLNIDIYQLHLVDLIRNPYLEIRNLCTFFGVECFDWYLDACAGLVQKKLSKSRNQVIWSKEQLRRIEEIMRRMPFLSRYSFSSED